MARLSSYLSASSIVLATLNQVQAGVTLYQPLPTDSALLGPLNQPEIIGVSAIGTVAGGATQYVATEVQSAFTAEETTITFSPTTFLATFVQGASTFDVSQAATATVSGLAIALTGELNCGPGNGNSLNCVENEAVSFDGTQTAATVTFAATPSPIFTITGSTGASPSAGGTGTGSPASGTMDPSPTKKSSAIGTTPVMAMTPLFMGFFYALVYIF